MSQQSFDLTPGQNIVNYNLHFAPLSAVVDNMTPYWVRLPDAGRYIAPYSTGGSVPLINAMGGTVLWEAPAIAGIAQIPFISNAGVLHITFVDEVLSYSPPAAIPDIAFNNSDAFQWNVGATLNQNLAFLGIGIRIDNPSGTAYTISGTGLIIPAWTTGWTVDILPPFNTIQIAPIANPSGVSNVPVGGPLTATIYSGKVGIIAGNTIIPATKNTYTFSVAEVAGATTMTRFWLLDNIASGYRVRLNKLIFTNPGIAQIYNIYQVTPLSIVGDTIYVATAVPVASSSSLPAFPGTVYYEKNDGFAQQFKSATTNQGVTTGSGTITLPANIATGDNVFIAVGCHSGNITNTTFSGAPAGWTQVQTAVNATSNTRMVVWQKNTVTPADSGTVVTFNFSGVTPPDGWVVIAADYGRTPSNPFQNANIATISATTTVTYSGLTSGGNNQQTVEVVVAGNRTTTLTGHTARANIAHATVALQIWWQDDFGNNAASYTPTAGTLGASTSGNAIDFNFTPVWTPMSFTLGNLIGSTASIPTGTTTSVDLSSIIGTDVIADPTTSIGVVAGTQATNMTLAGVLELV